MNMILSDCRRRRVISLFLLLGSLIFCGGCQNISEKKEVIKKVVQEKKNEVTASNTSTRIDTSSDMIQYVKEQLAAGQHEIRFRTHDLTIDDIQDVNLYLDGYYGYVSQCSSKKSLIGGMTEYILNTDISDNYYVEEAILHGSAIPERMKEAIQLKDVCENLLERMEEDLTGRDTPYRREKWIHDYLVKNTAYGYLDDVEEEDIAHESYGALCYHEAVCNGYAFAMKLLCDLSNVPCKIITGQADGENHAWNLVKLEDNWYHVDVTWDDPSPDQEGRIVYTYFNIDDDRASLGHQWVEDRYPTCDDMTYNYFHLNDAYCKNYDEFKEKCIEILQNEDKKEIQLMVGDYDGSIYSDQNMDFIFDYCDANSISYQSVGEIPYTSIIIYLE